MRKITIRISDDMHEELRAEAFEDRTSINTLVVQAIQQMIDAYLHRDSGQNE